MKARQEEKAKQEKEHISDTDFDGTIGAPLISKDDKRNSTENIDYLNGERGVVDFLAEVVKNPDNYDIATYERTALIELPFKSPLKHTLYVVRDKNTGEETTLSFNSTGKSMGFFSSTGAWVKNSETDVKSYENYKKGHNTYGMEQKYNSSDIDIKSTAGSVINSIGSNTTYDAFDHIFDSPNAENCNSAVGGTIKLVKSDTGEKLYGGAVNELFERINDLRRTSWQR